jgi:hypothetical protein
MELIIKKHIGKTPYTFTFAGDNLHEVIMESQKLSFPNVDNCGLCGSDDLYLSAHVTKQKKYKYTEIRCKKCRAELTLGTREDDADTMYLRKDESGKPLWKAFNPANDENNTNDTYANTTAANNQKRQSAKTPAVKQPAPQAPEPQTAQNNNKPKYSGKALNYATKISTARDRNALKDICGKIKTMTDLNETDLTYLRSECERKTKLFNAMPLS